MRTLIETVAVALAFLAGCRIGIQMSMAYTAKLLDNNGLRICIWPDRHISVAHKQPLTGNN
jgi:hypothetical protein